MHFIFISDVFLFLNSRSFLFTLAIHSVSVLWLLANASHSAVKTTACATPFNYNKTFMAQCNLNFSLLSLPCISQSAHSSTLQRRQDWFSKASCLPTPSSTDEASFADFTARAKVNAVENDNNNYTDGD